MIRFMFVVSAVFMAIGAGAASIGPDSSWEEIVAAGLKPEIPSFWFGAFAIPVTGVCADGELLKTIHEVERCVEFKHGHDSTECARTESTVLARPRAYTYEHCVRYAAQHECVEFRTIADVLPLRFLIAVRTPTHSHGDRSDIDGRILFEKSYTIDECR